MKVQLQETLEHEQTALKLMAEYVWPWLSPLGIDDWFMVRGPFASRRFVLTGEAGGVCGAAVWEIRNIRPDGKVVLDLASCCVDEEREEFLWRLFDESLKAMQQLFTVALILIEVDLEEADWWRENLPPRKETRHPEVGEVFFSYSPAP